MNSLYEKYFLGEMSGEEQTRLEQELAQNSKLRAQFEEDRALFESLKNQMLRRKIKEALAEPEASAPVSNANKNRWQIWLGLAGLLLLFWAVWKTVSSNQANESPVPPIPQQQSPKDSSARVARQPAVPGEKEPEPEKKEERQRGLIAHAPVEPRSLKGLRSSKTRHTPWADLVKKIWYAPLPQAETFGERFKPASELLLKDSTIDAFLKLQTLEQESPANDTLAFLKGWCLMELWEGEAALDYFDRLSGKQHPWTAELEWGSGQCYLLTGEKGKAIAVFKNIADQPKHPYRKQAGKALKLLQ
ncbi:MAG: hypothetical protein ACKVT2_07350 [Saprospiraceae bacterium]